MKRLFSHPWRLLFGTLGTVIFIIYFLPVFGWLLDISNIFGMCAGLLLLFCSLFWDRVRALLVRLWRKRLWRVVLSVLGVLSAAVLILLLVLSALVLGKMHERPTNGGTLIVLGCQVQGENPSLLLSYRIDAAAEYLSAHPDERAILTGGQGPGEDVTEAECMYRGLVRRGVDPARLFKEEQAHTTLENLQYSREILRREGLSEPAILVSNNFHIYRALAMAEDLSIPAEGLAAKCGISGIFAYTLREAMALVKYGLTGS